MSLLGFINTASLILKNKNTSRFKAISKHFLWQFRRIFKLFPFELKISNSIIIAKNSNSGSAALINCLNMYDHNNMNLLKILLLEGGNFIDVGANIGSYTLIASEQEKALVYAFEPHPKTFLYLKENIEINNRKNIKAFNFAVGLQENEVYFSDYSENSINHILQKEEKGGIFVKSKSMKVILDEEKIIPDFVKIDVEGFEYEVLQSFGSYLKNVKCFFIEFKTLDEDVSQNRHMKIRNLLLSNNYYGPLIFDYAKSEFREGVEEKEDAIFFSKDFKNRLLAMNLKMKLNIENTHSS